MLDRAADGDVAEAEAAIERLAAAPADEGLMRTRDIWLLRLRALLARAHGDAGGLCALAGSLPRHGHIAWLRGSHGVGRGDAMMAVGEDYRRVSKEIIAVRGSSSQITCIR